MKITKLMRIFLILLSVVMVLPLFACGEKPAETTTEQKKETTTAAVDETTAPEVKETTAKPETDATTVEPEAVITTEETAVTTESAEVSETVESSETSKVSETAETETTSEESTSCTHAKVSYNEDCDEICDGCGELLATEVHPDHKEEYSDGENNLRSYTIKCAVCDKLLYEYSIQLGEKVPEHIITADRLYLMAEATGVRLTSEMAEDGSYVTLCNVPGVKDEGYFNAYVGDGRVTGQYMLIKYRTTSEVAQQLWVGANNGGLEPSKGDSFYLKTLENNSTAGFVSDGEWRVTVIDLAAIKEGRFNAETEGENAGKYCADYLKWDVFDMGSRNAESVDVAYIAFADDLGKLLGIENVREYVYVQKLLGGYAIAEPLNALTDNPYFDPEYIATRVANDSIATVKKDETNNGLPYVELKSNSDSGEQKVMLWEDVSNMVKDSGNFLGFLYRRSVTACTVDIFINSNSTAPDKVSSKANVKTVSDGLWHLVLINISGLNNPENVAYYDPALGISMLRFDYFNGDRTVDETIDIAFIGTFDSEAQASAVLSDYYVRFFNDGSQICAHASVENLSYVSDNDENTVLAIEKFDCMLCLQKGLTRPAAFGTALETVDADTHISTTGTLFKMDNSVMGVWESGSKAYPSVGYVTPSAEGTVTANGWVGVNGDLLGGEDKTALGAAYMIVDAEGNVLKTWTEVSANFDVEKKAITDAVIDMGHGISPVGRRFKISADVSEFAGKTVNIIYAVIPEDIPEGCNDKYVPIIEIKGVKVP